MNSSLTELEKNIVRAIFSQNVKSSLEEIDISLLKVSRREETGVGAYIVFDAETSPQITGHDSDQFGFEGDISIPNLPSGLGAVLDIEQGRINHLELFTYGDETWDGNTSDGSVS